MFERLEKPFLTVETGEAYQPIRLSYQLLEKERVMAALEKLRCVEKASAPTSWNWYWSEECAGLHFESLDSFRKNPSHPVRLATMILRDDHLYINLPSFKRACMAVTFFHQLFGQDAVVAETADFINKVFGLDERLPHGFAEVFKEEELDHILQQRVEDYHTVKAQCEKAKTAEAAFKILSEFTHAEAKKKLPYAERYNFDINKNSDPDVVFLGFYIFLRSRELVAIKRWFGETGYSLADAAEETMESVFGGMGIDLID